MSDAKQYYLYLWRHRYVDDNNCIVERTCYGITSNPERRLQAYEGHVGHSVRYSDLWSGPERLIRELESQIDQHSAPARFVGINNYRYEWITEAVKYEDLRDWIDLTLVASVTGVHRVDAVTYS